MKITINLTDAEVLGIKNYLKSVSEIGIEPTKKDIINEVQGILQVTFQSPKESLSSYIQDAENIIKNKP